MFKTTSSKLCNLSQIGLRGKSYQNLARRLSFYKATGGIEQSAEFYDDLYRKTKEKFECEFFEVVSLIM